MQPGPLYLAASVSGIVSMQAGLSATLKSGEPVDCTRAMSLCMWSTRVSLTLLVVQGKAFGDYTFILTGTHGSLVLCNGAGVQAVLPVYSSHWGQWANKQRGKEPNIL